MDIHDEFIRWIIYLQSSNTVVTAGTAMVAISHCGHVQSATRLRDGKVLK